MSASAATDGKHKILLLDDDPEVLDLYQQMLLQLPSQPEVHIATSGASAMTLLDTENFSVLISDLNMPKMDGLQVLAIVRRKYPMLRTVVLTGVTEDQMRSRAYAMGIDLYLEKPRNQKEVTFLIDCIESLLDKEQTGGFRGVQSKSMVDLIQLECLSGSSSVLKITNGKLEGRIWIHHGEVTDAATQDVEGEEAFRRISSWTAGNFEILPGESERPRRILTSYQGLLLDTVQAMDEARADSGVSEPGPGEEGQLTDTQFFRSAGLGQMQGVEFALKISSDAGIPVQKWGIDDPEGIVNWIRGTINRYESLHPGFELGVLQNFEARSPQRVIHVTFEAGNAVAVAMLPNVSKEQAEQNTRRVLERWAS